MARIRRSPEFLALLRRQLDARTQLKAQPPTPMGGWIKTVRTALGMSAAQLGLKLGISQQAVATLERNERTGAISLSSLSRVADALDCEVHVHFTPRTSLEQTVREQAAKKARSERNRVVHTMRLEAQDGGVHEVLDEEKAADAWMTRKIAKLWD